jgi:uncharacterized membrane protein
MAFGAQYSVTVALFEQQVEAWLLGPMLIVSFLMILIKALLELPVFYAGLLLIFVALNVQSVLQHFAYVCAPKPSQKQISQHFLTLWRQLEEELRARAAEKPSPTAE